MRALSEIFLGSLEPRTRAEMGQVGDLEQQLARLWRESTQAWPELELPVDDFLPHVARRMRRDLPPGQRLVHARGPDLFLACACASGVERAIATFEEQFGEEMAHAVKRLRLNPSDRSELLQEARAKLFCQAFHKDSGKVLFAMTYTIGPKS